MYITPIIFNNKVITSCDPCSIFLPIWQSLCVKNIYDDVPIGAHIYVMLLWFATILQFELDYIITFKTVVRLQYCTKRDIVRKSESSCGDRSSQAIGRESLFKVCRVDVTGSGAKQLQRSAVSMWFVGTNLSVSKKAESGIGDQRSSNNPKRVFHESWS